jgi:hypothetical protein
MAATRSETPLRELVATDSAERSVLVGGVFAPPADLADFDFFAAFRFFVVMIPISSSSAPQENGTSS